MFHAQHLMAQASVSAMTRWRRGRRSTSPGPAPSGQLGPSGAWATGPSSAAWSRSGTRPCSGWSASSWRASSTATTPTTLAPPPGCPHGRWHALHHTPSLCSSLRMFLVTNHPFWSFLALKLFYEGVTILGTQFYIPNPEPLTFQVPGAGADIFSGKL